MMNLLSALRDYLSEHPDNVLICSLKNVYYDIHADKNKAYLGSFSPHHTPIPAIAPSLPLFEQAPSVKTTSQSFSFVASLTLSVVRFSCFLSRYVFFVLDEEDGGIDEDTVVVTTSGADADVDPPVFNDRGPCLTNASASKALRNFLYEAFGNPLTWSSHSFLSDSLSFHDLFEVRGNGKIDHQEW